MILQILACKIMPFESLHDKICTIKCVFCVDCNFPGLKIQSDVSVGLTLPYLGSDVYLSSP